jgi:RNA polymerase sigma-70 factor (ECF subfamily)
MDEGAERLEQEVGGHLGRGDLRQAATVALRGYGPQILGYLTAVMKDEDAAHDVFSEFTRDLWAGLPAFRRESSFRTWAYRVAWHAALRALRDPHRKRMQPLGDHELSGVAAEVRTETAQYLRTEPKDRIRALRAELDPDEQTLLTLRLDRRMSWREVAQVLAEEGKPVSQPVLWKRFERLKAKLKRLAEREGLL